MKVEAVQPPEGTPLHRLPSQEGVAEKLGQFQVLQNGAYPNRKRRVGPTTLEPMLAALSG